MNALSRLMALALAGLLMAALMAAAAPAIGEDELQAPSPLAPPNHILFFVDYSGSMNLPHYLSGEFKIVMAKRLLSDLIRELPDGFTNLSIYTFSPFEAVLPDGPLDKKQAMASLDKIRTDFKVHNRRTELGLDLDKLSDVLASLKGTVSVVMLTDGYANLGPDPLERYRRLSEQFGNRVVFHFVSYAGRKTGQKIIKELRRIDGRGEYDYGDTLLDKGRNFDRLLRVALLHFPSPGADGLPTTAAEGEPDGFDAPVDPELAKTVAPKQKAPARPMELDLVVGLDTLLMAELDPGNAAEQAILLRPANKALAPAGLGPELIPGLVYVLAVLTRSPGLDMAIEVHTDSMGDEMENMEICRQWGRAVRDWLADKGVDPVRLRVEPYGELRPAYDNADSWGRRLNRRILFRAIAEEAAP